MIPKVICRLALPTAVVGLAIAPAAARASNTSIRHEIVVQNHALASPLNRFETAVDAFESNKTTGNAKKVAKESKVVERVLKHAASAVSRTHASSKKGRYGRKDWISSARHLATAYADLADEYTDLVNGDDAGVQSKAKAAERNIKDSKRLDAKADRDLSLPKGYGPMIRA